MSPDRPPFTGSTEHAPGDATATVVTFRPSAARRFRRGAAADAPRGEILLFTGIRYERAPEPEAPPTRLRRRS